jgi:hypothetical protein
LEVGHVLAVLQLRSHWQALIGQLANDVVGENQRRGWRLLADEGDLR